MKTGNRPLRATRKKKSTVALERFVGLFESRGWLNRTLRIRYRERRYRICCTEREFSAYRINDHCSVLPGYPGWSVCLVTNDQIVEDSDLSAFSSSEPDAQEWLHCMAEGDFELI